MVGVKRAGASRAGADEVARRERAIALALGALALLLLAPSATGAEPLVDRAPAVGSAHAGTRPPGTPALPDLAAKARVRAAPELRPGNALANAAVPTRRQLAAFHRRSRTTYTRRVTGGFTGTTDEILQWAAWKWGINEDVLRAVAIRESQWNQALIGDRGASFGLMQVKTQLAPRHGGWPATFPLARDSTAFNVDYYGRAFRSCYDGYDTWLGRRYHAGDLWGCVGLWFSGRWHDRLATRYIASVRRVLAERSWTSLAR
jgi:soluble lytic murein transglycosylase-like protein